MISRRTILSIAAVIIGVLIYLYRENKLWPMEAASEDERDSSQEVVSFSETCTKDKKFFVYLSPVNSTMADNLWKLYHGLKRDIGPMRNHWYPVHCTLSHGFYDCEENVKVYERILREAIDKYKPKNSDVKCEDVKGGYGIFAVVMSAPTLVEIMNDFVSKTETHTGGEILCNMVQNTNPYHMTLAWQFSPIQKKRIERTIHDLVNLEEDVKWEIRLFEVDEAPLAMHNSKWTVRKAFPLDN